MLPHLLVSTHFHPGRRPKPEIMASKEQQIQRDDPGASPQSSSQPDHGRLSRKPPVAQRGGSEQESELEPSPLPQKAHCCRWNGVLFHGSGEP